MADIGGFPVHNYGSDPLGRMGIEMFKSSLDWDEKQKELERKAVQEAATQQRGAFMETVKGGTAPPGVASKLYGSEIGGGVDRLSQQNQVTEELKRLTGIIKLNTDQQTYTEKQITSIETAQEKLMKRKLELMGAGGQEDLVVYMNDQLEAMDTKVSQLRGFNVGSSVLSSDLASWKTTKQEEATKQIATIGTELKTAMGAKEPDSEAIGAASAKLQAAVTTMQQKWKLPKETFTLESKLLGEADETMKQVVTAKLKPKEQKAPHYQDLGDKIGIFDNEGNMIKTISKGKAPTEDKGTAHFRDLVEVNKGRIANGQRPYTMEQYLTTVVHKPTGEKEESTAALKTLGTMINDAGDEPKPYQITLIKQAAKKSGYDYVKKEDVTKPGSIWGKVWPDVVEKGGWALVERKPESLLTGKKEGQYRVNGQIVNWDGSKIIP